MQNELAPTQKATQVFNVARQIGEQNLTRLNGQLTVTQIAKTLVNFTDRLSGIARPGSRTATDLQRRLDELRSNRQYTAGALLRLDGLQVTHDPRGFRIDMLNNELVAATQLAIATGVMDQVESVTRELSRANRLPSTLPTVTYPRVCEVGGKSVEIIITDPSPEPQTLFNYALYLQQQMHSNRAS